MGVRKAVILTGLIGLAASVHAAIGDVEWYISNPAGIALQRAMPLRALREKNALAVRELGPEDVPREIRKYYSAPWRINCSILYEDGKRVKTQWVFRDSAETALFVAAIGDDGSGFIEWYDDRGLIVEEQRLDADGAGYFIAYTYKDDVLLKAEARLVEAADPNAPMTPVPEPPVSDTPVSSTDETQTPVPLTDGAEPTAPTPPTEGDEEPIVGIDLPPDDGSASIFGGMGGLGGLSGASVFASLTDGSASGTSVFKDAPYDLPDDSSDAARNPQGPAVIPASFVAITGREGGTVWTDFYRYTRSKGLRSIERVFNQEERDAALVRFPRFVEGGPVDTDFVSIQRPVAPLFLLDVINAASPKVVYTTDSKRRLVTETHRDEQDALIGVLKNTWIDDRLASVSWTAEGDEREAVYSYNEAGARVRERNYRAGTLEREVQFDGLREVETLYIDGKARLRAVWLDGRKLSEERLDW